jgi:peptide/nickel transport system substrate-binding protein
MHEQGNRALPRVSSALAAAWLLLLGACGGEPAVIAGDSQAPQQDSKPRETAANPLVPVVADAFYPGFDPAHDKLPGPRNGGSVVVHLLSFPKNLNYMLDNSAVTRRMWSELHETLLRRNLTTWEYEPSLAESYEVIDQLVLEGGDVASGAKVVTGKIRETDEQWLVDEHRSAGNLSQAESYRRTSGARLLRGTAYDLVLRKDVKWQDGADFDARDVLFSLRCFRNKFVDCDEKRYMFDKIARVESNDAHEVRIAFAAPYFLAIDALASLPILPAHLYDLSDTRNPNRKAGASDEEQAKFIAEHPANRMWVGLGPYKVTEWSDKAIIAKRWDGYWDRANAGHVDEIVWREIRDDGAAITALCEGQLDWFDRLSGDDYFGGRTDNDAFKASYYKGYSYGPQISYVAWNTRREQLSDVRVRTALALCFDWDAYIKGYYRGLAERVTGEQFLRGPAYDATLQPLPFDLDRARALLAEAGWFDRDQDGIVERAGKPLRIELLYNTGSRSSELLGQAFQSNLAKVGVALTLVSRDWAAMMERVDARDFDALSTGWITPPVVDPEQVWHSKGAATKGSANVSGLADAEVDRLIGKIQVELDPESRRLLFANLQRRVYALQPYMFGVNVPRKFACSKRVRNVECFVLDPGYSIRRWFVIDPPKKS